MVCLPQVRIGEPVRHGSLSVFPLFCENPTGIDYRLADEAMSENLLTVEEVSEAGSVPELLVENKSDSRVLFLEGEQLIGAKQNRILNTSILVAAGSKVKIPVSCVERDRWRYQSRAFSGSGFHSPSKLRHALKGSVSLSAKSGLGHRSDQNEVWQEVDSMLACHSVTSDSSALSDVYLNLDEQSSDYRDKLKYIAGASGLAVAVRDKVVAIDLFDKPQTCEKVWDRLLAGCVLESLRQADADQQVELDDVQQLLSAADSAAWQKVAAVGEGDEFRADFDDDHASVLSLQDTVVHGSVLAG